MRSKLAPVCMITAAMAGGAALPSIASTYYASPMGVDTNPGTIDRPVRTLQRAKALLKPGDTVLIADGEYPGGIKQNVSGKPGLSITYKAINSGRVVLRGDQTAEPDVFTVRDASWIVVDGIVAQGGARVGIYIANGNSVTVRNSIARNNGVTGILTGYSDDLLIENNECYGNREQHGIYVSNSGDRPVVRYNTTHHNGRCGIQLNGDGRQLKPALGTRGDGIIMDAAVDGNVIYDNGVGGGAGINAFSIRRSRIANNLIYNNVAGGIALSNDNAKTATQWGAKDNLIVSNTVTFRRLEGRWCLSLTNGCSGNRVMNNILMGGAKGAYQFDETSPFKADHNVVYSAKCPYAATYVLTGKMLTSTQYQIMTGNDTHSVYADPLFVDPAGLPPNFHLRPGSPARGAGAQLLEVTADADGMTLPTAWSPDLGCYGGASMAGN